MFVDIIQNSIQRVAFCLIALWPAQGEGHYVHVLSSDWQPNSREGNLLGFVLTPFLRRGLTWQTNKGHMKSLASKRKWGYSLVADIFGR